MSSPQSDPKVRSRNLRPVGAGLGINVVQRTTISNQNPPFLWREYTITRKPNRPKSDLIETIIVYKLPQKSREQLVTPLPDELEELSKAISHWCEQHPHIDEAQLKLLCNRSGEKSPGSQESNIPKPKEQLNKLMLINAIGQSSSSHDSQSSNSGL